MSTLHHCNRNRISCSGRTLIVRVDCACKPTHRPARSHRTSPPRERTRRSTVTVKQELYLYANITSQSTPVCVFKPLRRVLRTYIVFLSIVFMTLRLYLHVPNLTRVITLYKLKRHSHVSKKTKKLKVIETRIKSNL